MEAAHKSTEGIERHVDEVMTLVNGAISKQQDHVASLARRLALVERKIDRINGDTCLKYLDEFPRVPFERVKFDALNRVVQFIQLDLEQLREPFLPELILPVKQHPINETHLGRVLSGGAKRKNEAKRIEQVEHEQSDNSDESTSSISDLESIDSHRETTPPPLVMNVPTSPPPPPPMQTKAAPQQPPPPPPPQPSDMNSRSNLLASIRQGSKVLIKFVF